MFLARPLLAIAGFMGLVALSGFSSNDAKAQQIFRSVGPDGRITFSDKVPTDPNARAAAARAVPIARTETDASAFPFALREAATRYPVTLYAGPGCDPCGAGRSLLVGRGIPFIEKSVISNEDIDALKRLAGVATLPFLTIGGQQLKGYSEIEWAQFLDAAGYPKTSQLPASYDRAPATPLVAAQRAESPVAANPAAPRPAVPAPAAPAENPTGIRF